MKKTAKKLISFALMTAMLATVAFGATPVSAKEYDNVLTLTINGTDCSTSGKNLVLYPNNGTTVREIDASEYYFRYSKVMIFDKDGLLIEAGGDMFSNSPSVTGSAQEHIYIPAGGFAIAFNPNAVTNLKKCFDVAMEGAVLYNATLSTIYEVIGSYSGNTLTVKYNNPVKSPTAKKFLFVGNSSTYFNGTPLKFKGLALSAGFDVDVTYCTYGSAFLYEYANASHERGKAFRNHLNNTKFDYVVLQDGGTADYSDSKPTMSVLLPLIEENGAEALLYMRYSSNSVPANRFESAKKHYINYTRLSIEHGLTVSPAASAFLICTDKYPEINLYADDNSHHSKEGSYLIACTMLMSYLGVDPVGVEYDAQLGTDVARKLQECAKEVCVNGYDYGVTEDDLTPPEDVYYVDGTEYGSVTVGKPYTTDGKIYVDDKWSDHDANGNLLYKYTDGMFSGFNGESTAIGCHKGAKVNIDIDLQGKYDIKAFKTQLFGKPDWGIPNPLDESKNVSVEFSYSTDGVNYISLGKANATESYADNGWTKCVYTLEPETNVEAKYIRATFNNCGFVWCDEISAYGVQGGNIALGKDYEISGIGERLDSYCAKLTDGISAEKLEYGKGEASTWFGFYNNGVNPTNAPGKLGTVTFDFENTFTIDKVSVNTLFGNTSGIQTPEYIGVEVSTDGVNYNEVAKKTLAASSANEGDWVDIPLDKPATARYVRVTVKLTNTFAFINEINIYGEEAQATEYTLGDINGDSEIDKYDYVLAKRAILNTCTLNKDQSFAADVNTDDIIDVFDYILIKRHVMGTYKIDG